MVAKMAEKLKKSTSSGTPMVAQKSPFPLYLVVGLLGFGKQGLFQCANHGKHN